MEKRIHYAFTAEQECKTPFDCNDEGECLHRCKRKDEKPAPEPGTWDDFKPGRDVA